MAILLHDTGYLKRNWDTEGTGAKYTVVHVRRSAEFASELLQHRAFQPKEILAIQNMILCTGINAALDKIPFQSELEKIVRFALGTADLMGQMAADDYVEKLPVLFAEFAEAASFEGSKSASVGVFSSADDLMQKTPAFWEKFVSVKLERDFAGVYKFLNYPYPSGRNYYVDRIRSQHGAPAVGNWPRRLVRVRRLEGVSPQPGQIGQNQFWQIVTITAFQHTECRHAQFTD